jgi:anti-anti-sigma factor
MNRMKLAITNGALGPGSQLVEPAGELDLASAPELTAAFDLALAAGQRRLIVDLSEVSFIDSSGLHALIKARKRLDAVGGGLFVTICPDAHARRVFEVSGLVEFLNVTSSRRDALVARDGAD